MNRLGRLNCMFGMSLQRSTECQLIARRLIRPRWREDVGGLFSNAHVQPRHPSIGSHVAVSCRDLECQSRLTTTRALSMGSCIFQSRKQAQRLMRWLQTCNLPFCSEAISPSRGPAMYVAIGVQTILGCAAYPVIAQQTPAGCIPACESGTCVLGVWDSVMLMLACLQINLQCLYARSACSD